MLNNTAYQNLGTEWLKNATYLWNIPLHPLGELDIFNFITKYPNSIEQSRVQLLGTRFQLLINIWLSLLFARNFRISLRMVILRVGALPGWCCLITAAYGVGFGILSTIALCTNGVTCRMLVWFAGFGVSVGIICNTTIVLQKAYLVLCKNRPIAIIGCLIMIPQFGYCVILVTKCPITINAMVGCVVNYPTFLPWFWFGVSVPINAFFSAIFAHITYKQYRAFGSDAWKHLSQQGIQTMCLVVLCNLLCSLIILLEVGGVLSLSFYLVDWLLTSSILTGHCRQMRKTAAVLSKPKSKTPKKIHVSPPKIIVIAASQTGNDSVAPSQTKPVASSLLTKDWLSRRAFNA